MQLLQSQEQTHELYSSYRCQSPPPAQYSTFIGYKEDRWLQMGYTEIDGNYHDFFGSIS